ncbi:MAG: DEAD/DEAH box helicase [Myxococcales bacterium]|nr:DEAD/DEAH box helicase [Myxococcales bacterium]
MTERDADQRPLATTFAALGLAGPLLRATAEFEAPTPVQAAAIPAILRGEDVWASSQTGSGKTAAFVLPLLQRLSDGSPRGSRAVPVVVLVPTRELALQVADAIRAFGAFLPTPPKACVAVGGVSINPQMMALRGGADVVVATPGRLLDLVAHNALTLDAVATLVLDEADRMLSLGFADELAGIVAKLPERRQTLLFSATFPHAVRALADEHLNKPTRINIDGGKAPDLTTIAQRAIEVDAGKRTTLLRHLLDAHGWSHVLVFVESRHRADHVVMKLKRAGVAAAALHGDLSQGARTGALAEFKAQRVRVLVATDVAARGLDIAHLPAVVNYDLPRSPTDYVHRIGRTGRAGDVGVAISFVTADAEPHFRLIERRHRVTVPREKISGFERLVAAAPTRDAHGGVKGKRKSKKDKRRELA